MCVRVHTHTQMHLHLSTLRCLMKNHSIIPLSAIENTFLPCTVGEGLLVGCRKGSLEALDVFRKEPSKSWPGGLAGAPKGSKVVPRKQRENAFLYPASSLLYSYRRAAAAALSNTWKTRLKLASWPLSPLPRLRTSSRTNSGSQHDRNHPTHVDGRDWSY